MKRRRAYRWPTCSCGPCRRADGPPADPPAIDSTIDRAPRIRGAVPAPANEHASPPTPIPAAAAARRWRARPISRLPLMDRLTLRWFSRDLNLRGELRHQRAVRFGRRGPEGPGRRALQALFDRAVQGRAPGGHRPVLARRRSCCGAPPRYPGTLDCETAQRRGGGRLPPICGSPGGPVHVGMHPVTGDSGPVAELVLLQDLSFIERRSQDTRQLPDRAHRRCSAW